MTGNWRNLHNKLQAELFDFPQKARLAEHALREVEQGLAALSAIGYLFHLEDGPGELLDDWPRIMYHVDAAPNGRVVLCEADLDELGPGWYHTPQEAHHATGYETQMHGRGGVPKRVMLPAIIYQFELSPLDKERLNGNQ